MPSLAAARAWQEVRRTDSPAPLRAPRTSSQNHSASFAVPAYGKRGEIASLIAPPEESRVVSGVVVGEVSTGGTLFANALSMAAGRAALLEVLTEDAFEHTAALGERMAVGLREAIARAGVGWSVAQIGGHAYYFFEPTQPSDAAGSRAADDPDLRALIRVFMANRGVWESGWWLGPTVSVAHNESQIDITRQLDDTQEPTRLAVVGGAA